MGRGKRSEAGKQKKREKTKKAGYRKRVEKAGGVYDEVKNNQRKLREAAEKVVRKTKAEERAVDRKVQAARDTYVIIRSMKQSLSPLGPIEHRKLNSLAYFDLLFDKVYFPPDLTPAEYLGPKHYETRTELYLNRFQVTKDLTFKTFRAAIYYSIQEHRSFEEWLTQPRVLRRFYEATMTLGKPLSPLKAAHLAAINECSALKSDFTARENFIHLLYFENEDIAPYSKAQADRVEDLFVGQTESDMEDWKVTRQSILQSNKEMQARKKEERQETAQHVERYDDIRDFNGEDTTRATQAREDRQLQALYQQFMHYDTTPNDDFDWDFESATWYDSVVDGFTERKATEQEVMADAFDEVALSSAATEEILHKTEAWVLIRGEGEKFTFEKRLYEARVPEDPVLKQRKEEVKVKEAEFKEMLESFKKSLKVAEVVEEMEEV